jgi:hypothetical protein
MKTMFLDIETIPCQRPGLREEIRQNLKPPGNISKAESIEKWMKENAETAAEEAYRKTACDGTLGEICCISWAIDDNQVTHVSRDLLYPEDALLKDWFDWVKQDVGDIPTVFKLVGHNIIGFDLRFIFQRAVINRVRPRFPLRQDSRGNGDFLYDTMLAWAGWGNYVKITKICEALGIAVKSDGIDGSKVYDEVLAGNISRVAAYCDEDVEATREVYYRMTFAERRAA